MRKGLKVSDVDVTNWGHKDMGGVMSQRIGGFEELERVLDKRRQADKNNCHSEDSA